LGSDGLGTVPKERTDKEPETGSQARSSRPDKKPEGKDGHPGSSQ